MNTTPATTDNTLEGKKRYRAQPPDGRTIDLSKISLIFHLCRSVKNSTDGFGARPKFRRERKASSKQSSEVKANPMPKEGALKKLTSSALPFREPRYVAHWRIAIVYDDMGKNEIFHGRTYEVSLRGASIYSDRNVFIADKVTVLLAVPSRKAGQKERIIEIKARMAYTVLSSDGHQFRIGMQFLSFKNDEESCIETALSDKRLITSRYM